MDVWDHALGFMHAQVVLTADEIGVFDHLARGPSTAAAVAGATSLPEDSARRLLTALCALDLVHRDAQGRYLNAPEAAEKLVRAAPGYVGALFRHVREELYPVWHYFKEALVEGQPQWQRAFDGPRTPTEAMYSDPEALRAFMDGMHAITFEASQAFARRAPELEAVQHLVDLGGASGAFVIALAQHWPHLRATVYDLPQVRPIAEDHFRRHGLEDRLDFCGGSFFVDPLPAGADAYTLGFVLHDWDTEGGTQLLAKIAAAIRPGGLLIVGEFLLNDDRTGPLYVARSDLNMLTAARGRERTADEYAGWLAAAGFALQRIQPTNGGKHFLIARHSG